MSQILQKHKKLVGLIFKVLDETATPDQHQELAELIRRDAEAQMVYLQLVDIHSNLMLSRSSFNHTLTDTQKEKRNKKRNFKKTGKRSKAHKRSFRLLASVLILFVSFALTYFGYRAFTVVSDTEQESEGIAENRNELRKVQRRVLDDGSVELLFPTGVEVIISASSSFQVLGANEVSLSHGMLFAKVTTEEGKGFTVNTPRGTIIDLGTVFGVEIDNLKNSTVQVIKGEVLLTDSSGAKNLLSTGGTMSYDVRENQWESVENISTRFNTQIQKLNSTFFSGIAIDRRINVSFIFNADAKPLAPYKGLSYIMYTATPVEERFVTPQQRSYDWSQHAEHFVEVHFDALSNKWQLHMDNQFSEFTPVQTDLLIAQADPAQQKQNGEWMRKITLLNNESGTIHGIPSGDQVDDFIIRTHWFSERPQVGNFTIVRNVFYP